MIKKGTGQRIVADTQPPVSNVSTSNKKRHLAVGDKVSVKGLGICTVSKLTIGWVYVKSQDKKEHPYTYPGSFDKGVIKLVDN